MTTDVPRLELLPAVDVVDGQAVQLQQGIAGSGGAYGDPIEAGRRWQESGAQWLHLVDLDAAFGRGNNTELLTRMVELLDLQVELTGGIRDQESLEAALATGCARVNIGTAAIEKPEWTASAIRQYGDRIALALDVRGERLAGRGWTSEGGDLWEALAYFDEVGCARYVVTDVAKDGMLAGPNTEMLARVCEHTDAAVVASGGVSSLGDLRALRSLVPNGVEGVIVGSALYEGAFTLGEALDVTGRD